MGLWIPPHPWGIGLTMGMVTARPKGRTHTLLGPELKKDHSILVFAYFLASLLICPILYSIQLPLTIQFIETTLSSILCVFFQPDKSTLAANFSFYFLDCIMNIRGHGILKYVPGTRKHTDAIGDFWSEKLACAVAKLSVHN
jgi:hypothetical protein